MYYVGARFFLPNFMAIVVFKKIAAFAFFSKNKPIPSSLIFSKYRLSL